MIDTWSKNFVRRPNVHRGSLTLMKYSDYLTFTRYADGLFEFNCLTADYLPKPPTDTTSLDTDMFVMCRTIPQKSRNGWCPKP